MPFFVYVLRSETAGVSYVGHTNNIHKRLDEHNNGKSKSTRNKRPWELIYYEEFKTRSEAMSRERYYKTVKGRLEMKSLGIIR
jgi:putative endonuclease